MEHQNTMEMGHLKMNDRGLKHAANPSIVVAINASMLKVK